MITMIAAVGANLELGLGNRLLWDIPQDMRHFRQYTHGKTVMMGRKTFESIGSKPLPNRRNVVVSGTLHTSDSVKVIPSMESAYEYAGRHVGELVVIGGQQIYEAMMDVADQLVITHVHSEFTADTFFPTIDHGAWCIVNSSALTDTPLSTVVTYRRRYAAR